MTELETSVRPFPDHELFEGRGGSWDGKFNGEDARFGVVLPNTIDPTYVARSPKVIRVMGGTATVAGQTHEADEVFTFPGEPSFVFETGSDEEFSYISRKASTEVVASCDSMFAALIHEGIGTKEWFELPRAEKYERLADRIGNTPTETVAIDVDTQVTLKQEFTNPSGSHYDRAYLKTLQELEKAGFIRPGDELRDITSGSAGISLAMLGGLLGYGVRITIPDELPANRIYPMLHFGARVASAGAGYVPRIAEFQADEIKALKADPAWTMSRPSNRRSRAFLFEQGDERICYVNHSENEFSPDAFREIADELVEQIEEAPDAVFLAAGNWTTIAGIAPTLRTRWPDTQIVAYEGEHTEGAHNNFGTTVEGLRLRYKDPALVDQIVAVSDSERDVMAERVNPSRPTARQLGRSSIMGLAAANRLRDGQNIRVVTIAYDTSNRY